MSQPQLMAGGGNRAPVEPFAFTDRSTVPRGFIPKSKQARMVGQATGLAPIDKYPPRSGTTTLSDG